MDTFLHHVAIAAPLFSLVFVGYALMRFSGWPTVMSESLSRFVFSVALTIFHTARVWWYKPSACLSREVDRLPHLRISTCEQRAGLAGF
ncbi:MAG: hypothetical protein ABI478_10615, partial [Propionivibrio sp.]